MLLLLLLRWRLRWVIGIVEAGIDGSVSLSMYVSVSRIGDVTIVLVRFPNGSSLVLILTVRGVSAGGVEVVVIIAVAKILPVSTLAIVVIMVGLMTRLHR